VDYPVLRKAQIATINGRTVGIEHIILCVGQQGNGVEASLAHGIAFELEIGRKKSC